MDPIRNYENLMDFEKGGVRRHPTGEVTSDCDVLPETESSQVLSRSLYFKRNSSSVQISSVRPSKAAVHRMSRPLLRNQRRALS